MRNESGGVGSKAAEKRPILRRHVSFPDGDLGNRIAVGLSALSLVACHS